MRVLRTLEAIPPDGPECVVALGVFDGVHRGHQEVLRTAVRRARAIGVPSLALTFDPLPIEVIRPGEAPPPMTSLGERLALIAPLGLDTTLILPFTREFSRTEPEDFVSGILKGRLRAREVVVGFNHTFGRGARGNAGFLEAIGSRHGMAVHVIPPLTVDGAVVSSSAIRELLRAGDVKKARLLLGHLYEIRGVVLRGAGRGAQLGFPTANLKPGRELLLAGGVYAAWAHVEGATAGAVVNLGVRPTFEETELWVEAYLLDWSGDLYDRTLSLEFLERIRPEQKFPGVEALRAQIARDVSEARRILAAQRA
jgi:riboflavin kinase/FMN adenylyltransferase